MALLVRSPQRFDVIVTTNMFGDILSDLAGELSGSLGLAGSIMAGDERAMAQAQHGSAPDIQGRDIANPTSLILSAAMLLDWLGKKYSNEAYCRAAAVMDAAVDAVLENPAARTADLGGGNTTAGFAAAVMESVAAQPQK
jgi:3-isopropylmalate dehydrogenase